MRFCPRNNMFSGINNIIHELLLTHNQVVTSSRYITEVKQRRSWLVLGWVTGALVMLPAMCRGVGQASHIIPPLSTEKLCLPGVTRRLNCNDWLYLQQNAQLLNSPQRSDETV